MRSGLPPNRSIAMEGYRGSIKVRNTDKGNQCLKYYNGLIEVGSVVVNRVLHSKLGQDAVPHGPVASIGAFDAGG